MWLANDQDNQPQRVFEKGMEQNAIPHEFASGGLHRRRKLSNGELSQRVCKFASAPAGHCSRGIKARKILPSQVKRYFG